VPGFVIEYPVTAPVPFLNVIVPENPLPPPLPVVTVFVVPFNELQAPLTVQLATQVFVDVMVAEAVPPAPPFVGTMFTVGAVPLEKHPVGDPALVMETEASEWPFAGVTVATAVAPVPPPPTNATVGADV
jgi:hypothetical protein